jgi:two-component system, LytTR family, response regulator LytT
MKVLIIEDEQPAARQLTKLLQRHDATISIIEVIDSVEASVKWLQTFPMPDAVFMDIQIADGLSFDIFNHVEITCPVVFTTAFDQYAIKAFKVNAVDYLLKPIDEAELQAVLEKIKTRYSNNIHQPPPQYSVDFFKNMLGNIGNPSYKERFLVKIGQNFSSFETSDIAYFFSEEGITQFYIFQAKKYLIDHALDELETQLNPKHFFRINRKLIVHAQAIQKISPHFNGRLKLEVTPPYSEDIFVSRERVNDFKTWLGG